MMTTTNDPIKEILKRCKKKPLLFVKHVLGIDLTPDQKEVFMLVWTNQKVAVPSGHSTGKSYLTAILVLTFLYLHRDSQIITTSSSFKQLKNVMWANIRKIHAQAKVPLGGTVNQTEIRLGPDWFAIGIANDKPDAFQGYHAKDIMVIFDECQNIPMPIWEATESMISSENSHWFAVSNPTQLSTSFAEACDDPEWKVKVLSCLNHPNVLQGKDVIPGAVAHDWPAKMAKLWGVDSALYKSRVLGLFPDSDDCTLISVKMIMQALSINDPIQDGKHMGVDIARFGDDSCVASILDNGKLTHVIEWSQVDTMGSVGRIIALFKEHDIEPENVHIDVCGVGGGVVDRLYEQNYAVDPVNAAEKPQEDWIEFTSGTEFLNRKAELWWAISMLIKNGHILIPEEFKTTWRELKDMRYEFDSRGKIKMESKADLKKRTGRSPDYADSLVLAISRSNQSVGIHLL